MSVLRWKKVRERTRRRQHATANRRIPLVESLEARQLLASIQGTVWNDYNGDGKIAFGEPRLPNWQVYLDANNNGTLDTSSSTLTLASADVPKDIPDLSSITSQRVVSGLTGIVKDLNVRLTIDQPDPNKTMWDDDMDVFLVSPTGTRVELFTDVGGSGQDFTNTLLDDEATKSITTGAAPFNSSTSGSYQPEGKLSDFDGEDPNGTWILQVTDDEGNDVGTLESWSLILNTQTFTEANTLTDASGNYAFFGLAASTQHVRMVSQMGFNSTYPTGNVHNVTVTTNQQAYPYNFGVRQTPSSVTGSMWEDYDGNTVHDTNEPVMAGRSVFLDANNNGVLDSTTVNQTFAQNTSLAIPDLSTVRSTIAVPADQGRVTDINVTLKITHPNITDLTAYLISPSGTRVKLFQTLTSNGPGFNNTTFDDSASTSINDAIPPFSGTFRPDEPLSTFIGESALGTWQLEITDNGAGNTGTLNNWSMAMTRINAERSTVTDANGDYSFFGLAPGTYDIAQAAIPGYTPTAPRSVTLTRDQNFDVSMYAGGGEYQPMVSVDPTNINRLFAVTPRAFGGGFVAATSTDGGVVWATRNLTGSDGLPTGESDPDVAFDEFGNLFLTYRTQAGEIVVANSTDGGASFSLLKDITAGAKPAISAASGAVWVSFTRNNQVSVAGAAVTGLNLVGTFTIPVAAPDSVGYSFSDVEIGPAGELAVIYVLGNSSGQPTTIRMAVDPDGLGSTGFGPSVHVADTNVGTANFLGTYSTSPGASIDWDRSGGERNGRIYVVYADETPDGSQNLDIKVVSTDDFGTIWTAPVRVNTITANAQFMPGSALDQTTGDLFVDWYDASADTGISGSGSNDSFKNTDVKFVGAITVDGGTSFRVTSAISDGVTYVPGSFSGQNVGNRTGLAFHNGVVHPLWVDNSNSTGNNPDADLGDFDLYTASIQVNAGGRSPHHVVLTPGTTLTNLNFANHLNPKLTGFTTIDYVENSIRKVGPGVTVTQPTVPSFENGTLTVRILANAEGTDRLGVYNTGNGPGQVGVSANEIRYGGIVVATFVGGAAPAPLVVRFNSNSTLAAAQAVVRSITFRSLSDNPSTTQRRVNFVLTDGHRGTSAPADAYIKVQRVNDAPIIWNLGPAPVFEEDEPPVYIAPAAKFTDYDSFNFNAGQLTIKLIQNGQAGDLIAIKSTGNGTGQISAASGTVKYQGVAIGTYSGGNGTSPLVITFNGSSTILSVQALIQSLQFSTSGQNPSGLTRKVSLVMTDGDGGTSTPATKDLKVMPINDAPILTASGSVGYTLNAASIAVAPAATITDVDNANFASGNLRVHVSGTIDDNNRVSIGGSFTVSGLQVKQDNTVIGTINVSGGSGTTDLIVTFNGNATVSVVQQLIRAIRFRTANSSLHGNRAVNFTVDDGSGATSNTAIRTVQVA
jgi:subtilisin-like proprotein convertase family protein